MDELWVHINSTRLAGSECGCGGDKVRADDEGIGGGRVLGLTIFSSGLKEESSGSSRKELRLQNFR